jgi:D-glycero-alpha-D-manno-heptose 1-phosphate guanylyltransferase
MKQNMVIKNELLVLAGGFGTRLRSAVGDVPKPLANVAGRPFLHHLVENWLEQGVDFMTFLLHHGAQQIESYLNELNRSGFMGHCNLRTLSEAIPLGTGGAVAYAVREFRLTGSFLVANADTWLGSGIHCVSAASSPAMAVLKVADTTRYGSVRIEGEQVVSFAEKDKSNGRGYINAGLYQLPAALFADWDGKAFSMERDVFPRLVSKRTLNAASIDTDFIDIGIPEDYYRFCRWIESGRKNVL